MYALGGSDSVCLFSPGLSAIELCSRDEGRELRF